MLKLLSAIVCSLIFIIQPAYSAVITVSLPDYDGPGRDTGATFPYDLGVIGTFIYSIPGSATITFASFSGTYGTATVSDSTAGFDVSVDGAAPFTVCTPLASNCYIAGADLRNFFFPLSSSLFIGLLDGEADLQVIQTSSLFVRLGSPTLTIEYVEQQNNAQVPLPSTALLLGAGLLGLGWNLRRRGQ